MTTQKELKQRNKKIWRILFEIKQSYGRFFWSEEAQKSTKPTLTLTLKYKHYQ
jgi:hypothetical protein